MCSVLSSDPIVHFSALGLETLRYFSPLPDGTPNAFIKIEFGFYERNMIVLNLQCITCGRAGRVGDEHVARAKRT